MIMFLNRFFYYSLSVRTYNQIDNRLKTFRVMSPLTCCLNILRFFLWFVQGEITHEQNRNSKICKDKSLENSFSSSLTYSINLYLFPFWGRRFSKRHTLKNGKSNLVFRFWFLAKKLSWRLVFGLCPIDRGWWDLPRKNLKKILSLLVFEI